MVYMKKGKVATFTAVPKTPTSDFDRYVKFEDISGSQQGFSVSFDGSVPSDFLPRLSFKAVAAPVDMKKLVKPRGFQFGSSESRNFNFGGFDDKVKPPFQKNED